MTESEVFCTVTLSWRADGGQATFCVPNDSPPPPHHACIRNYGEALQQIKLIEWCVVARSRSHDAALATAVVQTLIHPELPRQYEPAECN